MITYQYSEHSNAVFVKPTVKSVFVILTPKQGFRAALLHLIICCILKEQEKTINFMKFQLDADKSIIFNS